ncbi:MAG: type III-B CRISPR module-associated protein Cmr5 [Thermofilaceae archaeon]|nr:type III-B CRISPR module-associated protein Cmr5 [Thermofilaceae archaeon]MDW8004130.1 type III-B CRISPR module-associated protein Cmr5 [Thermofilaceae archaeon]
MFFDEGNMVKFLTDVIEKISTKSDTEPRRFRSRARQLTSDLFTRGLAYTLVLIASRGSTLGVEQGLFAENIEDLEKRLSGYLEGLNPEEKGYTLYGAVLLMTLRKFGIVKMGRLADVIKDVVGNPSADAQALIVADWIARLADAFIQT